MGGERKSWQCDLRFVENRSGIVANSLTVGGYAMLRNFGIDRNPEPIMLIGNLGSVAMKRIIVFLVLLPLALRASELVPGILSHQGRIAVNGVNFDGAGQFKFALVNGAGDTSLWSNDGSSAGGAEPTAAAEVTVAKGHYAVLLGEAPMPEIPATVFSENADVRLRIWFSSDGGATFEVLSPDRRITPVGYAMVAKTAESVADGAITGTAIADGAVTSSKLADGLPKIVQVTNRSFNFFDVKKNFNAILYNGGGFLPLEYTGPTTGGSYSHLILRKIIPEGVKSISKVEAQIELSNDGGRAVLRVLKVDSAANWTTISEHSKSTAGVHILSAQDISLDQQNYQYFIEIDTKSNITSGTQVKIQWCKVSWIGIGS